MLYYGINSYSIEALSWEKEMLFHLAFIFFKPFMRIITFTDLYQSLNSLKDYARLNWNNKIPTLSINQEMRLQIYLKYFFFFQETDNKRSLIIWYIVKLLLKLWIHLLQWRLCKYAESFNCVLRKQNTAVSNPKKSSQLNIYWSVNMFKNKPLLMHN